MSYTVAIFDGPGDNGRAHLYSTKRAAFCDARAMVAASYRDSAFAAVLDADGKTLAKWVNVKGRARRVNV